LIRRAAGLVELIELIGCVRLIRKR
jgi:hypothetical protein